MKVFTWNSRIIPACAGSSHQRYLVRVLRKDHPRLRGEQSPPNPSDEARRGSSPPARGADGLRRKRIIVVRIIPACAGSRERNSRKQMG